MDKWLILVESSLGNSTIQKITRNASSMGEDKGSAKVQQCN